MDFAKSLTFPPGKETTATETKTVLIIANPSYTSRYGKRAAMFKLELVRRPPTPFM
jgi:hypothetical protein